MYISVLRGTPVLVLLMLIFYVVFASVNINPVLAATVAFGMNFAAYVAEIFRTGIEGIDKGQTEAGIAMGFSKTKTFLYIVLPQTVRRILPVYKGEFISLVKMTSIVGYIAVQDLTKASDIIRSRTFDAFFPLVMVATRLFRNLLGSHAVAGIPGTGHRSEIQAAEGATRMIKVEHLFKVVWRSDGPQGHHDRDQEGRSRIDHRSVGHRQEHVPALPEPARARQRRLHLHRRRRHPRQEDRCPQDPPEDEHGLPVVQSLLASLRAGEPDDRPDKIARHE